MQTSRSVRIIRVHIYRALTVFLDQIASTILFYMRVILSQLFAAASIGSLSILFLCKVHSKLVGTENRNSFVSHLQPLSS